jgi:hypothetical protein
LSNRQSGPPGPKGGDYRFDMLGKIGFGQAMTSKWAIACDSAQPAPVATPGTSIGIIAAQYAVEYWKFRE